MLANVLLPQTAQVTSLPLRKLHTGLSVESSKEDALQAELSLVQAEEAALPLKITKLQEALSLENAKLQRREAGVVLDWHAVSASPLVHAAFSAMLHTTRYMLQAWSRTEAAFSPLLSDCC